MIIKLKEKAVKGINTTFKNSALESTIYLTDRGDVGIIEDGFSNILKNGEDNSFVFNKRIKGNFVSKFIILASNSKEISFDFENNVINFDDLVAKNFIESCTFDFTNSLTELLKMSKEDFNENFGETIFDFTEVNALFSDKINGPSIILDHGEFRIVGKSIISDYYNPVIKGTINEQVVSDLSSFSNTLICLNKEIKNFIDVFDNDIITIYFDSESKALIFSGEDFYTKIIPVDEFNSQNSKEFIKSIPELSNEVFSVNAEDLLNSKLNYFTVKESLVEAPNNRFVLGKNEIIVDDIINIPTASLKVNDENRTKFMFNSTIIYNIAKHCNGEMKFYVTEDFIVIENNERFFRARYFES